MATGTHIVIADDENLNRLVLEDLLQEHYTVHALEDGQAVLDHLAAGKPVDLVLLDIIMPRLDGFETCRRIKADPRTRDLPVLFLSGLENPADEELGLSLGAGDFIHKPFSPSVVLARVRTQLDLKEARERLEAKVAERTRALEQAQNQLLQSEKMSALGQLAAGVAHELNNPIGFIGSNFGILEGYIGDLLAIIDVAESRFSRLPDPEAAAPFQQAVANRDLAFLRKDIPDLMAESRDGIDRVRQIVADLKCFSHAGEQTWQWADVHKGLESTLNVVRNEIKYKAEVIKDYGKLPEIYCVAPQLNQVFMNLLVNAGQAIETQGRITIATGTADGQVWVEISDTGKGIAPEHLDHLFEPFFTTKPVGKGTGLGLSISWNIVKEHHGTIAVDSQPGVGTRFRVTLPVQPPAAGEAAAGG